MKYSLILIFVFIFVPLIVLASCNSTGYTVVYINGILTTKKDAKLNANKLQDYLGYELNSESLAVHSGYNESHIGGAGDIIESASQLFNSPVSNYDRNTILLQLYLEITTRKILLVGHSQGTFYTNEIYNYLLANGEQKDAVGVYNLATPASYVSGSGKYLTSENDKVINSVRDIASKLKAKQPLLANIDIPLTPEEATSKIGGHSFGGVYLAGASARIVSEISDGLKKLSATEISDTADTGCFTSPQKDISYYTQKALFAVADPAVDGAVIAAQTAYGAALAAAQTAVKIAETIYTNIEKMSSNLSPSKGSALIANSFGNSGQSDSDAVTTDNNSASQNAASDNQAEEKSISQIVLDTSSGTENKPLASQKPSAPSETNVSGLENIASSTIESNNPDSQSDDSNSEATTSTPQLNSGQADSGQATTTQNNNISGGGSGGGSAIPVGGVSVVLASSVPAPPVSLVITEIMYDALGVDTGHEWVEIFNNGTSSADITKLKFFESGTNHKLNTAQGPNALTPGSYAVLTNDSSKFLSDYPSYVGQLFDSSFSLSNSGEAIAIKNSDTVVDEITYSSSTGANGDGNSLQLINGLWQATLPTPGKENKIVNKPPTVIFKFSPANPKTNEIISFDASSSTD